jgi:hypothetical protein
LDDPDCDLEKAIESLPLPALFFFGGRAGIGPPIRFIFESQFFAIASKTNPRNRKIMLRFM